MTWSFGLDVARVLGVEAPEQLDELVAVLVVVEELAEDLERPGERPPCRRPCSQNSTTCGHRVLAGGDDAENATSFSS